MSIQMNIYNEGEWTDRSMYIGEAYFQKSTTKNMDLLWKEFYRTQDFPEFYMGKVEKMARCICPGLKRYEWYNAKNLIYDKNLTKGSEIIAQREIGAHFYQKTTLFINWETSPFHQWRMKSGNVLQIRQDFIDGLSSKDRRFLRMSL